MSYGIRTFPASASDIVVDTIKVEGGVVTLNETTTPSAETNYGKIYTKSDNKLYFQDGAGTEHTISVGAWGE
jgi:hypothetical protein